MCRPAVVDASLPPQRNNIMGTGDSETPVNIETPTAPIFFSSKEPLRKPVARVLSLGQPQDESSRNCFPAKRKYQSARTLFEADHNPEATIQWLQGLEQKMHKRQRTSRQLASDATQQWSRWIASLEKGKPHQHGTPCPVTSNSLLRLVSLHQ